MAAVLIEGAVPAAGGSHPALTKNGQQVRPDLPASAALCMR